MQLIKLSLPKITLINILFLFVFKQINAQNSIIGKTFIANTGHYCKEYNDGVCDIYKFCEFSFDKDSVNIYERYYTYCNPIERGDDYKLNNQLRYKWKIAKNIILIDNYYEFDNLEIQNSKLIGLTKNGEKNQKVEFTPKIRYFEYRGIGGEMGAGDEITISLDSLNFKSFLRGKIICEYKIQTSPYLWLKLNEKFDYDTFIKIKSAKSNLYYDGHDSNFFINTETERISCRNASEDLNYKKMEPYFVNIIDILSEYIKKCELHEK